MSLRLETDAAGIARFSTSLSTLRPCVCFNQVLNADGPAVRLWVRSVAHELEEEHREERVERPTTAAEASIELALALELFL
jgi:hypothetical protein